MRQVNQVIVRTLLRRLARYKHMRDRHAPPALLAAESALIGRSVSLLTADDLLQVVESFSTYWASTEKRLS